MWQHVKVLSGDKVHIICLSHIDHHTRKQEPLPVLVSTSPSPLQQRNPAESRSSFLFGTIYDLSEADSLWSCMFIWSNRKTTLVSRVWTGVMPLQLWFARIKRWACFMTFLHTRELLMLGETLCPYLRLSIPCLPVPYFYLISLPSWDFLSVPFALPSIDMVELQFPGFEFSLGCLSS